MIVRIFNNQIRKMDLNSIMIKSNPLLTIKQLAKILKISTKTVERKKYNKIELPKPNFEDNYIDVNLQQMCLLDLDLQTYAIALMINSFARSFKPGNMAFVSFATMGEILNLNTKTVSKAVKELEGKGIIDIHLTVKYNKKNYTMTLKRNWFESFEIAPCYKLFGDNSNLPCAIHNEGKEVEIQLSAREFKPAA